MPETIQVALIAAISAVVAGVAGAVLGAWIAGRATRAAAATNLAIAEADRREARRARFADAIRDLAIEALEAAGTDVGEVLEQWNLRDRPQPAELPWRVGGRAFPVFRRLRMLVVEPAMLEAVKEFELAIAGIESHAISTNKPGMTIYAPEVDPEEREGRPPALARYLAAIQALEAATRVELGSEGD